VFGFGILPGRRNGCALKNPARALHVDEVRYTLSLDREFAAQVSVFLIGEKLGKTHILTR
jgi:hypothetical protein